MSMKSLTSMTQKLIFLKRLSISFFFFQPYAIVQTEHKIGTKIMYPKVKANDETGHYKQRGSCLQSSYLESCASQDNQEEEDFQIYVAKIPKIYIPSVLLSENESKEMTKHIRGADIEAKQKLKPSPILRPRAVVSSPDNDAMIGSINKREERKAKKGLKSDDQIRSRASSQRKNIDNSVKISRLIVPKQSGVHSRDHK